MNDRYARGILATCQEIHMWCTGASDTLTEGAVDWLRRRLRSWETCSSGHLAATYDVAVWSLAMATLAEYDELTAWVETEVERRRRVGYRRLTEIDNMYVHVMRTSMPAGEQMVLSPSERVTASQNHCSGNYDDNADGNCPPCTNLAGCGLVGCPSGGDVLARADREEEGG